MAKNIDLSEQQFDILRWALNYAHQMLCDAQADGDGAITIGDRIDELEGLNYKLHFLDAEDYGELADG